MLYPPTIFAGAWALNLFGLLVSGSSLNPISAETYLIYIMGAVAFSFGGIFVFRSIPGARNRMLQPVPQVDSRPTSVNILKFIDVALILLVIAFPLYWKEITNGLSPDQGGAIFSQVRMKMVDASNEVREFSFLGNLVVLSQFIAIATVYEFDGSSRARIRSIIAILVAIVYGSASGTKGNAVILMVQIFFILSIKKKKIHWRSLFITTGLALCFFSLAILWVNYAYMGLSGNLSTGSIIIDTVQNYWLGGLVGFDRIVHNPAAMPLTQPIYRFFLESARSLGMNVNVPPLHADYTIISSNGMDSNTYTIYFSYFKEFGWAGVIVIMSIVGAGVTMIYQYAKQGNTIFILFYTKMCIAMVFSFHAEHFFVALNSHIKFLIFLYVLYRIVPRWGSRRAKVRLSA